MSDYDEGYRAGMQIVRELAHKRIEELEAKLAKAVEALTPSGETKAAYIAEVKTDCPSGQAHTVSWTATKEIMKMIRHFAELKGQNDE